ncbi:MAG: phosphatase PAP2 family protein [Clostridia bacterium]|nr:phosphatase PAP2 family protein [Deltaproteobacteria bacterium]
MRRFLNVVLLSALTSASAFAQAATDDTTPATQPETTATDSDPTDNKRELTPAKPATAQTPVVPPMSDVESPVLEWDPAWARAGTANYVLIGGAVAGTIAFAIKKPLSRHNLDRPILFDEGARNALRLKQINDRFTARDASDVLLSLETTWPIMVDSVIVAYGTRRSPHVAFEMAIIDAEALAISSFVQTLTADIVSRPRPYVKDCGTPGLPSALNDCVRNTRFRSFFSGHSALAFTGASLVCAHRQHLELFGPTADIATCITAYVAAAATATLRVVGDVHYASDVITGALVGTAVGWLVPTLHYRRRNRAAGDVNVQIVPQGRGLGLAVQY